MDGLRLSLIVVGVVVVALVYFWTARRRRIEREAGSFDRFHAWPDDSRDPLVDDGDDAYRRLEGAQADEPAQRVDAVAPEGRVEVAPAPPVAPAKPSTREKPMPQSRVAAARAAEAAGADEAPGDDVLEGLEAIVDSLRATQEPVLGELSGLDSPEPVPPPNKAARRKKAPKPGDAAARRGARRKGAQMQTELELTPPSEPLEEGPEMVVVLNVMARNGERLEGDAVHSCLKAAGLRYGEMQAYHFHQAGGSDAGPALFSVLNAVKPGTLDPADSGELRTPGLALVMRLPGPGVALERFETMREMGERLARELDAQLCDASRSTLTRQAANHLREQIAEYGRRKRLGG